MTAYSAGLAGPNCDPDQRLANQRLDTLEAFANEEAANCRHAACPPSVWRPAPDQTDYGRQVGAVREAILEGEIYQANIASLWARTAPMPDPFGEYLALRQRTEAAFSAFGNFPARTLLCFSPERLACMDRNRRVRAEPIKGTRRRSTDPAEDCKLAADLSASAKDRAENIMIVDLLRNDLAKVCETRSVEVTRLCERLELPNLYHLVSEIEAVLSPDHDAIDLLGALFPGGSVTGAPKLRAMEIIDELEPATRGAFCGSFGYIGFDGACDFNIMIRTIEHCGGVGRYWSGAGITLQSDPVSEWHEVQLKAERIIDLVRTPEELA